MFISGSRTSSRAARRVPPISRSKLIDLVEQEKPGVDPGFVDRLDDPARHRTDVGAAVASDFRFVPNVPPARSGVNFRPMAEAIDLATRSFPLRAGPTRQRIVPPIFPVSCRTAKYSRILSLTFSRPKCSALRIRSTSLMSIFDLDFFSGELNDPIKIGPDNRGFGRHRWHLDQPFQFFVGFFLNDRRQFGGGDLLFVFSDLRFRLPFFFPQLFLDRPKLFPSGNILSGLFRSACGLSPAVSSRRLGPRSLFP